jgi:hypothetical protein
MGFIYPKKSSGLPQENPLEITQESPRENNYHKECPREELKKLVMLPLKNVELVGL